MNVVQLVIYVRNYYCDPIEILSEVSEAVFQLIPH